MLLGACSRGGGHAVLEPTGKAGPRTMSPGGQLVLGPHVRGGGKLHRWSRGGGTAGPPTSQNNDAKKNEGKHCLHFRIFC